LDSATTAREVNWEAHTPRMERHTEDQSALLRPRVISCGGVWGQVAGSG
jgi:hypothetical protein